MNFTDRLLKCSDCGQDFVFTAGEQLFFFDKQFKNDPKRCKLCKAKRAGLGRTNGANGVVALPLSRTETRTECSSCGVETTVPFKPTQGRPVLCRSCFQLKRVASPLAAAAAMDSASEQIARQAQVFENEISAREPQPSMPEGNSGPKMTFQSALDRMTEFRGAIIGYDREAQPVLVCAGERP